MHSTKVNGRDHNIGLKNRNQLNSAYKKLTLNIHRYKQVKKQNIEKYTVQSIFFNWLC